MGAHIKNFDEFVTTDNGNTNGNLEVVIKEYLANLYGEPKVVTTYKDSPNAVYAIYNMTEKEANYWNPYLENRAPTIRNVVSGELWNLKQALRKNFDVWCVEGTRGESLCFEFGDNRRKYFLEVSIGPFPDTIAVKNYTSVYDLHFE